MTKSSASCHKFSSHDERVCGPYSARRYFEPDVILRRFQEGMMAPSSWHCHQPDALAVHHNAFA